MSAGSDYWNRRAEEEFERAQKLKARLDHAYETIDTIAGERDAIAKAARAVVDGGKLIERGDMGTVVEVDVALMARLIQSAGR